MTTREIPSGQWSDFMDRFTSQHAGWLVNMEVLANGYTQVDAHALPFQRLALESGCITVEIGDRSTHVRNVISGPARVCLDETPEGAHEAVEIAAADGALTRLRFRVAMLTESVDGIAWPARPG
jgi:hypothetical protein